MVLYMKPAKGSLSFTKLSDLTQYRMEILQRIDEIGDNPQKFLEIFSTPSIAEKAMFISAGTLEDKVSHFVIRLACLQTYTFREFFKRSESLLFKFRTISFSFKDTERMCKRFQRESTEALHLKNNYSEDYCNVLVTVQKVIMFIINSKILEHYYTKCRENSCRKYYIEVPFQLVPSLVARREVRVVSGEAFVACFQLLALLQCLYLSLLDEGISHAIKTNAFHKAYEDPRMKQLFTELNGKVQSGKKLISKVNELSFYDVDGVSDNFPPCMKSLHKQLRLNHRLPHNNRVVYTLYLKEIGLSITEALKFWSDEYSKPGCNASCNHDWAREERKYVYGIRYLYGLEGKRTDYSAHSCESVQQSGLCPFTHINEMSEYYSDDLKSDIESNQPIAACQKYLLTNCDIEDIGNQLRNKLAACKKPTHFFSVISTVSKKS